MGAEEGADIRHRTKIILRNKSIMVIQEEVGECLRRIEGEADQDQCKGHLQLMDTEVDTIKEEVVREEVIQMEGHRREEGVGLRH